MDLWSLPGPAWLRERVVDALNEGRSVVLRLPRRHPRELWPAMRRAITDAGESVERLTAEAGRWPLAQLLELAGDASGSSPPPTLVGHPSLGHLVLWIDGVEAADWPRWLAHLEATARAASHFPAHARPRFVVCLVGTENAPPAGDGVDITVLDWATCVEEPDLLIWAGVRLREQALPALHRRLLAATAAAVSGWDIDLLDAMFEEPFETWFAPDALLLGYGRACGWDATTPASYALDTLRTGDQGRTQVHASLQALRQQSEDIQRRVWSAQAAVLLPQLELKRLALLDDARAWLQVPWVVNFGSQQLTINRLEDLELGHIAFQLGSRRDTPLYLRDQALLLRDVRNKLSHLEVLPSNLAMSARLL